MTAQRTGAAGWRNTLPGAITALAVASGAPAAGAKGSCNSVGAHSTCLDYTGSYWSSTPGAMRGHCSGPDVSLDREWCVVDPDTAWGSVRFGSCIYNQFAATEFITHFYLIGGGRFDTMAGHLDKVKLLCERSGGVWNWGPAGGR